MTRFTYRALLLPFLAVSALSHGAQAQSTWHVDVAATGPGTGASADPYATIQSATDAPLTVSGDTLMIAGGVYQENIDLSGKSLLLTGSTAPRTEIWGAPGAGVRVVTVASGETSATTFTDIDIAAVFSPINMNTGGALVAGAACRFVNCQFRICSSSSSGGALAILNGDVVATGCEFMDNTSVQGGAIDVQSGSLVLRDCRFEGNSCEAQASCGGSSDRGGAVSTQSTTLEISDCTFVGNVARRGGALHLDNAIGGEVITRNTFEGNGPTFISTSAEGGAIKAETGFTVTDSVFRRNFAGRGGGASGGRYERCRFEWNAAEYGGAAYLANVVECFLVANEARTFGSNTGEGGATHSCQHSLSVLFANRCYGGAGGADNTFSLDRCTVINNLGDFRFAAVRGNAVANSIIWGNGSTVAAASVTQLDVQNVTFSMVQDLPGSIAGPPLLFGRYAGGPLFGRVWFRDLFHGSREPAVRCLMTAVGPRMTTR